MTEPELVELVADCVVDAVVEELACDAMEAATLKDLPEYVAAGIGVVLIPKPGANPVVKLMPPA